MSRRGRKRKTVANGEFKKTASGGGTLKAVQTLVNQVHLQSEQKPEADSPQSDPAPVEGQRSGNFTALELVTGIPASRLRVAEGLIREVCEEVLRVLNNYQRRGHLVDLNTLTTGRRDPDKPRAYKMWEDYTEDDYEMLIGRMTGLVLGQILDGFMAECKRDLTRHTRLTQMGVSEEVFQFMRGWADVAMSMSMIHGVEIVRNPTPSIPGSLQMRRDVATLPMGASTIVDGTDAIVSSIRQLVLSTRESKRLGSAESDSADVEDDSQMKLEILVQREIKTARQHLLQNEIQSLVMKTVLWAVTDLATERKLLNRSCFVGCLPDYSASEAL